MTQALLNTNLVLLTAITSFQVHLLTGSKMYRPDLWGGIQPRNLTDNTSCIDECQAECVGKRQTGQNSGRQLKRRPKEICPGFDRNGLGFTKEYEEYVKKYIDGNETMASDACKPKIAEGKTVVVVGAGVAGLIAALMLERSGFKVVVLEGSDRVGGRVQTYRNSRLGYHADLGPMRIPMEHILALNLIKHYKLELVPFDDTRTKFLFGHHYRNTTHYIQEFKKKLNGKCGVYGRHCLENLKKLKEAMDAAEESYTCGSLEDFIDEYDEYNIISWVFKRLTPDVLAAELTHFMTTLNWHDSMHVNLVESIATGVLHHNDQSFTNLVNGFDELPRAMAHDLGPNGIIHLHSKVDEIRRFKTQDNQRKVKVHYHCLGVACNNTESVAGDYVIVTTPAPLTAGIKFDPELDPQQWRGIRSMNYARPVKVVLAFSEHWWRNEEFEKLKLRGAIQSDLSFNELWIPPTREDPQMDGTVLEKGKEYKKIEVWGNEYRISFMLKLIDSMPSTSFFNIFLCTATNNSGITGNDGDRIPGAWIKQTQTGPNLAIGITDSKEGWKLIENIPIVKGQWHNVTIIKESASHTDSLVSIHLDGKELHKIPSDTKQYKNVICYLSSPHEDSAAGIIDMESLSITHTRGIGVLVASYAYGMTSQRYTGMSDEDVVQEMIDGLAAVFSVTQKYVRSKLIDHHIKRWQEDPFELGGFVEAGVHEFKLYHKKIADRNENILFAGEHTHHVHGWINSALASGFRAVKKLLEDLCTEPKIFHRRRFRDV